MRDTRSDEETTPDSIATALKTAFRRESAGRSNIKFEVHLGGFVVSAHVRNGEVDVTTAPIEKPDLIIEAGAGIRQLMAQELTPQQALENKVVRMVSGDVKMLGRFAEIFRS